MMAAPPELELAPAPPPPQRRLEARLVVAQDVIAGIGLITGIMLSGISLWILIRRYAPRRPPPPYGPG